MKPNPSGNFNTQRELFFSTLGSLVVLFLFLGSWVIFGGLGLGAPSQNAVALHRAEVLAYQVGQSYWSRGPKSKLETELRHPASAEDVSPSVSSLGTDPWGGPFLIQVNEMEKDLSILSWSSTRPELSVRVQIPRNANL